MRLTKEELIEKYRDWNTHHDWWDFVYDNFRETLDNEGVNVGEISFEGFYHQGSYADFTGRVYNVPLFMEKNNMVDDYPMLYKLAGLDGVDISQSDSGRRRSSYIDIEIGDWEYHLPDMDESMQEYYIALYQADTDIEISGFEEKVRDVLEEHARDLYKTLQEEYEHLCSDEVVWETIQCNEWDKEVG